MSFVWTDDAVSLAHRLYVEQGLSAARTAAALAQALGATPTRNAVLGKAQRLGWSKAPPPGHVEAPRPPRRRAERPLRLRRPPACIPLPPLREVKTGAAPKLWTDRRPGECAFPVGEPDGPGRQLSCCAPAGGKTYCAAHQGLMRLPASRMSEDEQIQLAAFARRDR